MLRDLPELQELPTQPWRPVLAFPVAMTMALAVRSGSAQKRAPNWEVKMILLVLSLVPSHRLREQLLNRVTRQHLIAPLLPLRLARAHILGLGLK